MSVNRLILGLCIVVLLLAGLGSAADDYKPYLHKANVPDSPVVRMFGQYATSLFPGAATYTYTIDTPPGVNGLSPSVFVFYNSQRVKQRPSVMGAGWGIKYDLIYRDVQSTPDDTSDDKFIFFLEDDLYELIYSGGLYHTEVDYWFRIERNETDDSWTVTKQDGKKYRFGHNTESRLASNTGRSYSLKWFLDEVGDTHGNRIFYSYSQDPNAEDEGAVYLDRIEYNSDRKRTIDFSYETSVRPDRRRVYEQGNLLEESRRLSDIMVSVDDALVKRYAFSYSILADSLSALESIVYYGEDDSSILHTINFEYYDAETGFTNQTSIWKPTEIFSDSSHIDYGVRLLDVNNDGFLDIIRNKSGVGAVWINNKSAGWTLDSSRTIPVSFVDASGVDQGVRFGDVNKDGFTDLVVSKASGTHEVYLNDDGQGWELSGWSIPTDFVSSSGVDQGVLLVDVNADGRDDIVKSKTGFHQVYLNNGAGWIAVSWIIPAEIVDSSGVDQGTRLLDVNGDGLIDIMRSSYLSSTTVRETWLNNGTGWESSSAWTPPSSFFFTQTGRSDTGVRFADVNGDGLVDILENYENGSTTAKEVWLNTGNGWTSDSSWQMPESFILGGYNLGRRLGDVDGDGFADLIISYGGENRTYTKDSTTPFLIKTITNEYGGVTTINYTTSTQYNNMEDDISKMGFNIFVVSEVKKNNSLSDDFNTLGEGFYEYNYGKYDYDKSEFRGFGLSTETKTDVVIKHYFHQDDARKGKEYAIEVYNESGGLINRNVKDYNYTYLDGVYNLSLASSTTYIYEGEADPRVLKKEYSYNVFGNPQYLSDYGDLAVAGDEKYYNYSYGFNFEDWIIDKVSKMTVYDSTFNKVKEMKYYYDGLGLTGVGSLGELTKTEYWLEDGNNSYAHFTYDPFGNMISKTDSLGNAYRYQYDDLNIFVENIINPLGHLTTFEYDEGTGNLQWREENGIKTSYEYDIFGRIMKEIRPYGSSALPTKKYIYDFDGDAPERIVISLRTTGSDYDNISYYYDGFANLVQVKSDLGNGTEIVKNIFYDADYRIGSEQNPYFAGYESGMTEKSGTDNLTSYAYDALDRVVSVENPDGTSKNVEFGRYNITDYDENGHAHSYTLDGQDRISRVYERVVDPFSGIASVYVTKYEYDSNDNLVRIIDNEGNQFRFEYDALSRKIGMDDPDMGTWTYSYDLNGNLITQTDAKGQAIMLEYDALGRVVSKESADVNLTFEYDKDYAGTLSSITMNSDSISYSYDDRLRVIEATQTINGLVFSNNFAYDSQDRLVEDNDLTYDYNGQGKVGEIVGYLSDASYNSFGSVLSRGYENGITTSYAYDQSNNRLKSISSPGGQSLEYTYDPVGNLLTISDLTSGRIQEMSYDYLDRLVNATAGADSYIFSYNSIGNLKKLIKNNVSQRYRYAGAQAHAPSQVMQDSIGVDMYEPHELSTSLKKRVFEFNLINEEDETLNATFNISFGDEDSMQDTVTVTAGDDTIFLIEKEYSNGGDYDVEFKATNGINKDEEEEHIKFGTRAEALNVLYGDVTRRLFEFVISNDLNETVNEIDWTCNDVSSIESTDLSGFESIPNEIDYYFSGPGSKTFTCTAESNDGSESISTDVLVQGLAIEEYDVLYTNVSQRVVAFTVKNYYEDMNVEINETTNGATSTNNVNLSTDEDIVVITETNYTTPGLKEYYVSLSGDSTGANHTEHFKLRGAEIINYTRTSGDYTNETLRFFVVNYWAQGEVGWGVSNPFTYNTTIIPSGQSVELVMESSYTTQGMNEINVSVDYAGLTDKLMDYLNVKPLKLSAFDAVLSGADKSVYELIVENDLQSQQTFNWRLDTGLENVSGNEPIDINSDDIIILVETSYSTGGIYKPIGRVNSTSYNDSAQRVVVI